MILDSRPDYLPPSIPTDLADMIIENHGDPPVWWVGQFVKYLMRAHPNLMAQLKAVEDKYGLQSLDGPIVGVQIRRTDKVLEAKLYSVQEYMSHVSFANATFKKKRKSQENVTYFSPPGRKVLQQDKSVTS